MPGSPSPNKGYTIPTVFGDFNIWGGELNSNFTTIDLNIGGTVSIAVSGASASVSGTTVQNSGFKFTGSLSGTNTVTFTSYAGFAFIQNGTSGGQNISCGISGGLAVTVPNGISMPIWSDGLNFYSLTIAGGGTTTTGSGAFVLASGATVTNLNGVLPTGMMVPYAGTAAPSGGGWLFCDGSAVSRTTYAALFAVCSTNFGAGDGSTTFNLPDMRGRTPVGYDASNATGRMTNSAGNGISASTVGNSGGEQAHILSGAELAIHNHGITDPSHVHGLNDPSHSHSVADPTHTHGVSDPTHVHASGNIGFVTLTGSAEFGLGSNPVFFTTSQGDTAAAYTGIGIDANYTGIGIYGNFTGISMNASFTGISINNSGAGATHNNTQPGLVMGYIIKT